MGYEILKTHSPDGYLMKNCAAQISSVYPCTTTSALTTFETGLTPIEHGWLGWALHFKEINECIELFTGKIYGTERYAQDRYIAWNVLGFKNLFEQINEVNLEVTCSRISPFIGYKADTCEDVCSHIASLCNESDKKFIYAYNDQFDTVIHENGCNSENVKAAILLFDKQIEQLATGLSDTLLIITADHGLTDIKGCVIEDFPEINECLSVSLSREPRSRSFFIKPEYMEIFPKRFKRVFGNDFILMTGSDALDKGYFGKGTPHPRAYDFIGDYVAFATGNRAIWFREENGDIKADLACHAGLSREEMIVPLILIET
jgi:hypothetical protein